MRVFAQDEYARVALCENQQWLPLVVLVGLVGCSVPVQLKAEVFKTLAALARTPDIAATLWQSIEVSQVLATVPSSALHAAQSAGAGGKKCRRRRAGDDARTKQTPRALRSCPPARLGA